LGSVVVRVGDELFDGSIRSRLEQAREALGVA
jgi:F0F1-type ATP synthase delta subunit